MQWGRAAFLYYQLPPQTLNLIELGRHLFEPPPHQFRHSNAKLVHLHTSCFGRVWCTPSGEHGERKGETTEDLLLSEQQGRQRSVVKGVLSEKQQSEQGSIERR
ncbi:hypothetical protein LXL04_007872 [Taraxacum kok-saghyz]